MSKLDEQEFIQYLLTLCLVFDRKKSTCYIEDDLNFEKNSFFRAIGDPETDEHLNQLYYEEYDCFLSDNAIKTINRHLAYKAKNSGIEDAINFRVVKIDDRIYVNLGNGSVAKITKNKVVILYKVKVKFEINSNIGIMTIPDLINGDLSLLKKYIPVNQKYFKLILVFIFNCFFTDTHYVILLLSGASGSAKSFITTVIKTLIDPSPAMLVNQINVVKDLAIVASNCHLITINNSDRLSNAIQDAFCTTATGGASLSRTLHTSKGQTVIHTHNPSLINGIGDIFTRDDALDRSITIPLIKICDSDIVPASEKDLEEDFKNDLPIILGGIFNTLSKILAEYPNVKKPEKMNRMMDFHFLGCVTEKALAWKPGSFTAAYDGNIITSQVVVLEGSLVAQALIKMKRFNNDFSGTYSELKQRLSAKGDVIKADPRELSAELDRISSSLLKLHGIKVTKLKRSNSGSRLKITFN